MRRRSSTSRCSGWPCGCSPPTSWRPGCTAATRCPSSTALVTEPAGGQLPDQRRPVHHAHDAPVRPLLARLLQAHRPPGPDRRPALRRRRPPATPTQGVRRRSSTRCSPRRPTPSGRRRWPPLSGVWAPGQMPSELVDDPQVGANGYLSTVERTTGSLRPGGQPGPDGRDGRQADTAPEHGQHTEEILLELGLDWDQIIAHKESGAIL